MRRFSQESSIACHSTTTHTCVPMRRSRWPPVTHNPYQTFAPHGMYLSETSTQRERHMNVNLQITESAIMLRPDYLAAPSSRWTFSNKEVVLLKWGMRTVYTRQCLTSTNRGDSVPLIRNSGSYEAEGMS